MTARPLIRLSKRNIPAWLFVGAAWTAYGLVYGVVWCATMSHPLESAQWVFPVSMTVAWAWALLTPLVFRLTRAVTPSRVGWVVSIATHAVAALAAAAFITWLRRTSMILLTGYKLEAFLPVFIFWLDVWIFVYATLVVIGRALDLRRRYVDRTVRAHLLETQLARAQLQYLELQLQPHFLFNSLNAIQELAHEAPVAAERMLQRLHTLLAISLARSGRDEVTLDEELAALEPYLDIQRTRFSDWLTVHVDVPAGVGGALVPHLILQPLVENAIRHGLSVRPAPGRIVVSAQRRGRVLHVRVEDDGVGLPPGRQLREARTAANGGRGGIGLRNASERLRQLYGAEHRFELREADSGGVIVELDLPYREGETSAGSPALGTTDELQLGPTVEEITSWRTGEYSTMVNEDLLPVPAGELSEASAPQWQASGSFRAVTAPAARSTDDTPATDEPTSASRDPAPAPSLSIRAWLGIAGLWLALAVFWTNQILLLRSSMPGSGELASVLEIARLQGATSVIWLLLSPPVLWLARRFRIEPERWRSRLPIHVAAGLAVGFIHTGIIYATGLSATPILSGMNLNPLTGDFFVYFALLAWSHARDFVMWYRTRELEGARLASRIAGSRFQALRVQLRPQFLLSTLDLLADLVHRDVPRAERLIARLADTLRLTLDLGRDATTSLKQELDLLQSCVEAHRIGIRPAVRLECHVTAEAMALRLPSRLLCTMADDLLAATNPSAPLRVRVDVDRIRDATRIRLRGEAPWPDVRTDLHAWWRTKSVAEASVADAGRLVSVTFPDRATAVLIIADDNIPSTESQTPTTSPAVSSASSVLLREQSA